MNDKEKIEEALRLIEKLSIHKRFVHGLPFKDLEEIKKILESIKIKFLSVFLVIPFDLEDV